MMKIGEIVLMSICSKRLSCLVKLGRYQLHDLLIHLKPGNLQIEVNRTSKDYCDIFFNSTGNVPKGCDSLSQWFENGNSDILNFTATDSIEDVFSVCNRLRSDFRVTYFFWKLFPEDHRNLREFISTLDFDTCSRVYIVGGKVNISSLSFLIDRMSFKNSMTLTSNISYKFTHPRALDFTSIEYEDARWLKVSDLKSIRNGSFVDVTGRTNFDNHDINALIKYWTECKEKMFLRLRIKLKDGIRINVSRILKGVVSCTSGGRYFFIAKKLIQTHSFGYVEFTDGLVTLTTGAFASQLNLLIPVLKLLEQESDLTIKYSELVKKERELHARPQNEEGENDSEQEILKIEAEKRNVQTELNEINEKLEHYQVKNINSHLVPID
ncbi:unnamed protein product [Caenorhabditis brenneri]